jgi:hypothetical protein
MVDIQIVEQDEMQWKGNPTFYLRYLKEHGGCLPARLFLVTPSKGAIFFISAEIVTLFVSQFKAA